MARLRPLLNATLLRFTEVVPQWYRLYALHFGDQRSLPESQFLSVFDPALRRALGALVEGRAGEFASETIGLGEMLVEQRMPLEEAVASFGLFEESVRTLSAGDPSLSAAATFGKLGYALITYLTTAYFDSQAAFVGERIAARERKAACLPPDGRTHFNGLVGASAPMRELYQRIEAAGQTRDTVLIVGESGTGKGLIARAIHECSSRASGPFVGLRCAGFPKELMESELFGYKRQTLDGGESECLGLLRSASGGTVFIDELSEMDEATRHKVLSAIAEQRVRPAGSASEQLLDARTIVSASSSPLGPTARHGLRRGVNARLEAFVIEVPPLRERPEDIPLLVDHFVAQFNRRCGRSVLGVKPEALQAMTEHSWPGNVRELSEVIENACGLEGQVLISSKDLPQNFGKRHDHGNLRRRNGRQYKLHAGVRPEKERC